MCNISLHSWGPSSLYSKDLFLHNTLACSRCHQLLMMFHLWFWWKGFNKQKCKVRFSYFDCDLYTVLLYTLWMVNEANLPYRSLSLGPKLLTGAYSSCIPYISDVTEIAARVVLVQGSPHMLFFNTFLNLLHFISWIWWSGGMFPNREKKKQVLLVWIAIKCLYGDIYGCNL